MPSFTSLPLTARGPVSSLSKPIFTGSFAAWAKAAWLTERMARTISHARMTMCCLLRCRPRRGQHNLSGRPDAAPETLACQRHLGHLDAERAQRIHHRVGDGG